jgi:Tol biopolymer transport system component
MRLFPTKTSVFLLLLLGFQSNEAPLPPALSAPPFSLAFEKTVGGNKDIYVMDAGQTGERRLTDDPEEDTLPRFARPDGRTIVFSSKRTGIFQLFEVPVSGGAARRLRSTHETEFQADVSPDGKTFAFLSYKSGRECLWIEDRATEKARMLVCHNEGSVLGNPHFSPDGGRIVFSSNVFVGHQIYIVDVQTGVQTRLSGLLSGGCEPRFSPDGQHVVHVTRGHHLPRSWIVEHDLLSGAVRTLVDWNALNYDPVYAPDGSEIAFASNRDGDWGVYRQSLKDGRVVKVASSAKDPDYAPLAK